jgi:hypothetical protein
MPDTIDIKGQVNAGQARKTIIAAAIAGIVAGLLVIQADLPVIVDTMTPLGVALTIALQMTIKALQSGITVKDTTVEPRHN